MNVIIMILLISLLILVHELGHFLSARALGIKVDKFGFGLPFGPTLFEGKIGETKILVHALLLGGYVSFPDDDVNSDLPADSDERFQNKSVGQRAVVISAGVIANVLCAAVLVVFTAAVWGKLPAGRYDISIEKIVAPKDASVHKSGLLPGDKLYKINDSIIDFPFQVDKFAQMSKLHDGMASQELIDDIYGELKAMNPSLSPTEALPAKTKVKLAMVRDESPVYLSRNVLLGLERPKIKEEHLTKEQIELSKKIQGEKEFVVENSNTRLMDIAAALSDTKKPMNFVVLRNGRFVQLRPIYSDEKGKIGIMQNIEEVLAPTRTPDAIIEKSGEYLWTNTELMVLGLVKLFTGQIPMQDLHGIVAITKLGGDVIEHQGFFKGLLLTAIISLNLAIINILPIPALDGGHLLFLLIEKIKGSPVNEKTIEKIANAGFTILLILMFLIIFNDIFALVTKQI